MPEFSEFQKAYAFYSETKKHQTEIKEAINTHTAKPLVITEGATDWKHMKAAFAKLSQSQQKLITDEISALRRICAKVDKDYSEELKKAIKGFFEATEEKTDKKIDEKLAQTAAQLKIRSAELAAEDKPAKTTVKRAQRDLLLADCDVIANKIARLSTQKAVANIRRFDAATEDESLKIAGRIDTLIAELTALKNTLAGEE